MARTKQISDEQILYTVRQRLLDGGDKAAAFSAIAAATGLSAPALALRFGTQANMCQAAILAGWADLQSRAAANLGDSAKDVQSYLRAQSDAADIPALLTLSARAPETMLAAAQWREQVETALANHYGGGLKGRSAAGLVFAAWQGRMAWTPAGGKTFRLAEVIRSLG